MKANLDSSLNGSQDGNTEAAKRRERHELIYWYGSLLLLSVAACAAGVSVFFAYNAFKQAQRQADAAFAQNRPFLQVETMYIDNLKRSEGSISADISATVKNYGHSPAVGISIFSKIRYLGESRTDTVNVAAQECLQIEGIVGAKHTQGSVVFPDRVAAATDDGREVSLAALESDYEQYAAQKAGLPTFQAFLKAAPLELIGCLVYDEWGRGVHTTSFDFFFPPVDLSQVGSSIGPLQGKPNPVAIGFAD